MAPIKFSSQLNCEWDSTKFWKNQPCSSKRVLETILRRKILQYIDDSGTVITDFSTSAGSLERVSALICNMLFVWKEF